jgi:hypothetical protein
MLDHHRRLVNKLLDAQRAHAAFLECGTPQRGTPKRVMEQARDKVRAAVLADVESLSQREIAVELGVDFSEEDYKIDMKIPTVARLVRAGRSILDAALGEGEWSKRAEKMKSDGEHYLSLNEEGRFIEDLVRRKGWTFEAARSVCEGPKGPASLFRLLQITMEPPRHYPS